MSTISSTATARVRAAIGFPALPLVVNRWWVAYATWRTQQRAIDRFKSMSDRALADIGLTRLQIESTDRSDLERDRVFSRYF